MYVCMLKHVKNARNDKLKKKKNNGEKPKTVSIF